MARFEVAKQPKSIVFVTFAVMLGLFAIRAWVAPHTAEEGSSADMPLGRLIDAIIVWQPLGGHIMGALLVFINGLLLARLLDRYRISPTPTYLPVVLYLLGAYAIFVPRESLASVVAVFLLILSTERIIASFSHSYRFSEVFGSAFCLGLIAMIYSPGILLIPMLPFTLAIYRRETRENIVAVIGLLLPFLLCSAGWWVAGKNWEFIFVSLLENLTARTGTTVFESLAGQGMVAWVFGISYLLSFLYSVFLITRYLPRMRTRAKKIYIHLFLLTICTAAMLFMPSGSIITLSLAAVPCSLITVVFYTRHKGALSSVVYAVFIASAITLNILPFTGTL